MIPARETSPRAKDFHRAIAPISAGSEVITIEEMKEACQKFALNAFLTQGFSAVSKPILQVNTFCEGYFKLHMICTLLYRSNLEIQQKYVRLSLKMFS